MHFAVFRVADNTYCGEYEYEAAPGSAFTSLTGMCRLEGPQHLPVVGGCWIVSTNLRQLFEGTRYAEHSVFRGFEDPRGFVYQGRVHLIGTANIVSKTSGGSTMEYSRPAVLGLDDALSSALSGRILHLHGAPEVRGGGALSCTQRAMSYSCINV
jgi:hypothetical protein